MSRLDRSLYNRDEFKKGDRLERIRMSLIAGPKGDYPLTEAEEEYLSYLETAWSFLQNERSQAEAVKLLRNQIRGIRQFAAVQVMRDAITLFGDFAEVHRPTQRGMIRENLLKCIYECEASRDRIIAAANDEQSADEYALQGWMKLRAGYWKQLMDLDQITSIEDAIKEDTSIPEINFTTDPAALMEVEDTTYTEE